ncbi:PA2169 family four-helix-bundle protein [Aquihabitans sp. McL0605]|uniref:PA2169 family four-helix-bundle protein n=1 Tax=Aquihabitans sp. McL0605 TaxID=3415671 RepID=UPI003CEAE48A
MSNDEAVTKDLIQTLEDGKDGFARAADKVEKDGEPRLAGTFRQLAAQRGQLADELQAIAASYGDQIEASGTVAAKAHRGWMAVKDAIAGSDPDGVLDAAEQGEDHAVSEFEKALQSDISPELKTIVQRQLAAIRSAHDQVKALRDRQP